MESWIQVTLDRAKRLDFVVVYSSVFILAILLLVIVFFEGDDWYKSLNKSTINPWIPRSLWVVATILSYITFYMIWQDSRYYPVPQDLFVSVLYLISSFLFILWACILYYSHNMGLAFWLSIILFLYNVFLFVVVWRINLKASLFLIPNLLLYLYLIYTVIEIAFINDLPL